MHNAFNCTYPGGAQAHVWAQQQENLERVHRQGEAAQAQARLNETLSKMSSAEQADLRGKMALITVPILGGVGVALLATQRVSSAAWGAGLALTILCGLPSLYLFMAGCLFLKDQAVDSFSEKSPLLSSEEV